MTGDSEQELITRLKQEFPALGRLDDWWERTSGRLRLTSVGIALAHANLGRHGNRDYDLRNWING